MPEHRTTSGKLSDSARHVILPSGIVSTGWPAVRDTCSGFGVKFDAWQDGAGRVILAKRADGSYACSIGGVVISIPRQVGKTFLIGAIVFALCLLFPGTTVLWTAHRLRTANETFSKMQAFARRKKVAPHVAKIVLGSGDEAVEFHNGSRILFGARERGFGRGFDNVDVLVFDEAQILTENAIDDMVPATNTAANPLIVLLGTPPKPADPSEVFRAKRDAALAGTDDDTAYIEFSADRGCDPEDRTQWAKANPSYPDRTPPAAMLRMKKNLTLESFVREGLGVWDEIDIGQIWPAGVWHAVCAPDAPKPTAGLVLALEVNPDRARAAIAVGSAEKITGLIDERPGVGWALDETIRIAKELRAPVAVASNGPAASMIPDLERAGVTVRSLSAADVRAACGWFFDAVTERQITVRADARIDAAVAAAVKRSSGDAFVWARQGGDVHPLYAVTMASWAAQNAAKPAKPVFAY